MTLNQLVKKINKINQSLKEGDRVRIEIYPDGSSVVKNYITMEAIIICSSLKCLEKYLKDFK